MNLLPIFAGFAVGFLIGLTGMGGGAIMTPFLILVMRLNPVLAVGTDLVFAAATKIFGGIQHWRESNVEFKQVLWLASGSLPAAYLTAWYAVNHMENAHFVEDIMPTILGITLILVGIIIGARAFKILAAKEITDLVWPKPISLILVGAIGGSLVGITSIGGGTVIMALFLIFFSVPLHYLVGMDVMHGAMLALVPALTYSFSGQVDWRLAGMMLVGSLPGVWLGVRLVNKINRKLIHGILAGLIIAAGIILLVGGE